MGNNSKETLYGSPLFILRDECARDLFGALKKVKAIGFDGVELLGFFGKTAEEIKAMLVELNLKAVGNHVPWEELRSRTDEVIRDHRLIGCRYLTVAGLCSLEGGAPSEELAIISAKCRENGIRLLFHNHAEELQKKVGSRTALEDLLETIPADVLKLEPDLGWMQIGGANPVYFLNKYKDRCPVIHLKDFYISDVALFKMPPMTPAGLARGGADSGFFEFRPMGYGVANTPMLLPYVRQCQPEWIVMDHDCAYDRDPYVDLALSLEYVQKLMTM